MTDTTTIHARAARAVSLIALVVLPFVISGCAGATNAAAPAGTQVIKVASQGQFTPESVAKAGAPIRLEFGPGSGCTAAVTVAGQTPLEDLTDGGGTVDLPALGPGEYPLICQSNMSMGVLQVQ